MTFSLFCSISVYSSDSTMIITRTTPILYIGHFNNDAYVDTLYGIKVSPLIYLPKWIVLGKSINDSTTPELSRLKIINYPKIDSIRGIFTIGKYNQDTLNDIEFYFHGKIKDSAIVNNNKSIFYRDTAETIILFGQDQINDVSMIDLDSIPRLLDSPIYTLRLDNKLDYKNVTNLSNIKWYVREQKKIDLIIPANKHSAIKQAQDTSIAKDSINIKSIVPSPYFTTYPNPANKMLYLKYENIMPTILKMYIYDVAGNIVFNQNFYVTSCLIQEFDLSKYSTGTYSIKIFDNYDNFLYQTNFVVIK